MADSVVWLVERDHGRRASLRAELIERGYDAVGFESLAAALSRPPALHAAVLVVADEVERAYRHA